jgi:hypothetical protein
MMVLLAFGQVVFGGCGKKAPPVAPKQPPLAAVKDLTAVYENGRIVVRWHHPGGVTPAAAYQVLQSRNDVSRPACPDCPLLFERVTTESVPETLRTQRLLLEVDVPAVPGFIYHFKVVPLQSSGAFGPDSNVVNVTVGDEHSLNQDGFGTSGEHRNPGLKDTKNGNNPIL